MWLWHSGGPLYYFFLAHDKPLAFTAYLTILVSLCVFFFVSKAIAEFVKPASSAVLGAKKKES